jgi:integrase
VSPPSRASHWTSHYAQAIGPSPIRFHDLGHSAATLLLAQGVRPRFIMELLGHSSINLTMNTYGHVLEEMKKETANQMDAVFDPVAVKSLAKD